MGIFRRRIERRDFGGINFLDPNRIPTNWDDSLAIGFPVNAQTAMRQSAVWASVQLVANAVATLPVDAFRKVNDFPKEVEPIPPVLARPHPSVSMVDFLTQGMVSLLLRGNFYALVVVRDLSGFPSALLPLNPDRIHVRVADDGSPLYKIGDRDVPAADILHIRGLSHPGDVVGLSVIDAARQNIGLALSAEQFGHRFFSEGTNPTGVLMTEEDLSSEDMDLLRQSWEASHGGTSRRPAVLTSGLKWTPISVNPDEAQFLETRKFQVSDIARLFGVPPHLIGDVDKSTSWGTGIEEQNLAFLQYSLRPWLVRWEGALSALLPRPQFVKFNVDAMLRGRTADQYAAFQTALAAGFLTLDEVRELIERRPLPPPPPPPPTPIPPLSTEEPQDGP